MTIASHIRWMDGPSEGILQVLSMIPLRSASVRWGIMMPFSDRFRQESES